MGWQTDAGSNSMDSRIGVSKVPGLVTPVEPLTSTDWLLMLSVIGTAQLCTNQCQMKWNLLCLRTVFEFHSQHRRRESRHLAKAAKHELNAEMGWTQLEMEHVKLSVSSSLWRVCVWMSREWGEQRPSNRMASVSSWCRSAGICAPSSFKKIAWLTFACCDNECCKKTCCLTV